MRGEFRGKAPQGRFGFRDKLTSIRPRGPIASCVVEWLDTGPHGLVEYFRHDDTIGGSSVAGSGQSEKPGRPLKRVTLAEQRLNVTEELVPAAVAEDKRLPCEQLQRLKACVHHITVRML